MLSIPDRRDWFSKRRPSIPLVHVSVKVSVHLEAYSTPIKLFDGFDFILHPIHNDLLLPASRFVVLHQPGEGFELEFGGSKGIRQPSWYIAEPIGHRRRHGALQGHDFDGCLRAALCTGLVSI
jgi:hypothetical protein